MSISKMMCIYLFIIIHNVQKSINSAAEDHYKMSISRKSNCHCIPIYYRFMIFEIFEFFFSTSIIGCKALYVVIDIFHQDIIEFSQLDERCFLEYEGHRHITLKVKKLVTHTLSRLKCKQLNILFPQTVADTNNTQFFVEKFFVVTIKSLVLSSNQTYMLFNT